MSVNSLGYLSGLTTDFTNVRAMGDFAVDGVLTVQNFSANSLIGHLSANTVNAESGSTLHVANGYALVANSVQSGGAQFDVRAFGVTGDGVTDDAAAIRSAFSAVPTSSGVVHFPPGIYQVGSTITIPVDRYVKMSGAGQGLLEGATPLYHGTVFRRASGFTGAMFRQVGVASPQAYHGVTMENLSISGILETGNAVELDYINCAQFENVTFSRVSGYAVKAHGLQNSWFRGCRWYRSGNTTQPVVMLDATLTDNVGSQGVDFIGCTWENNHGTDLLLTNVTDPSTVGTSNINILGGKFEQSLAAPPAKPLCKIVATQNSQVRTCFANGQHHDGTHLQVGDSSNTQSFVRRLIVDCNFTVFSATDSVNPRYLVDVQDGGGANALSSVVIRGTFHRGGGDSGAQIRVGAARAAGFGRVTIDPCNVYTTPLSGIPITGVFAGPGSVSTDRGDASVTVVAGVDAETQLFDTTLTAPRTFTLSKTAESGQAVPQTGALFRLRRSGLGAFPITVLNGAAGSTLKEFPTSTAATGEFLFNGTDWILSDYGVL